MRGMAKLRKTTSGKMYPTAGTQKSNWGRGRFPPCFTTPGGSRPSIVAYQRTGIPSWGEPLLTYLSVPDIESTPLPVSDRRWVFHFPKRGKLWRKPQDYRVARWLCYWRVYLGLR